MSPKTRAVLITAIWAFLAIRALTREDWVGAVIFAALVALWITEVTDRS